MAYTIEHCADLRGDERRAAQTRYDSAYVRRILRGATATVMRGDARECWAWSGRRWERRVAK